MGFFGVFVPYSGQRIQNQLSLLLLQFRLLLQLPPIATLTSADHGAEVAVEAVLTSSADVLGSGVTGGALGLPPFP